MMVMINKDKLSIGAEQLTNKERARHIKYNANRTNKYTDKGRTDR